MNNQKSFEAVRTKGTVLITGGSGLIGRHLTPLLQSQGFKVAHLSRNAGKNGDITTFRWEPDKGTIDPEALVNTDCIIHLAGANIGEKRWTEARKRVIKASRTDTAGMLFKLMEKQNAWPGTYITASAVGYYGSVSSEKIFSEDDAPADDFLGNICRMWEEAADRFGEKGIRTVRIRTGVVLDLEDSALSRMVRPAKYGLVARLGTGRQYFPWIHISDLCNIYLKAVTDSAMNGAYNAVAPGNVTHDEFIASMAQVMRRPVFLPHVPSWVLKAVLGEMAEIVLEGSRVSAEKIISAGYKFRFPELEGALRNILGT